MGTLFQQVEGAVAILNTKGVEQQVDVYTRNGFYYAEVSKGKFVRIYANGSTTKAAVRIDLLHSDDFIGVDRLGRLRHAEGDSVRPLTAEQQLRIEGGSE